MAWVVIVTTWGLTNSFGVFQTYYTSALGVSPSTVSWIGSVQLWLILFSSAVSGRALDAGLFIPTFFVGSVLQLIGIFMQSLCTNFWQLLLAQGFCTGLGSGIIFCPALGLVTTYFSKHRGIAISIVTTGNSLGGVIYPFMVRQLLPSIGFPWTVRVIGFINLACLSMALALMRPRLPPRKSGPLVEWQAFKELPYLCAVIGFTFVFGALFFVYYYVSLSPFQATRVVRVRISMPDPHANDLSFPDRLLRLRHSPHVLRRLRQHPHNLQRRWRPSTTLHRLGGR